MLRLHVNRTCPICQVLIPQSSHAAPRRDRGGPNTCLHITLAVVCRSALSRKQWRLSLSKIEQLLEVEIGPAWAVSYFADQLMTL